jgi:hypothetical protein
MEAATEAKGHEVPVRVDHDESNLTCACNNSYARIIDAVLLVVRERRAVIQAHCPGHGGVLLYLINLVDPTFRGTTFSNVCFVMCVTLEAYLCLRKDGFVGCHGVEF